MEAGPAEARGSHQGEVRRLQIVDAHPEQDDFVIAAEIDHRVAIGVFVDTAGFEGGEIFVEAKPGEVEDLAGVGIEIADHIATGFGFEDEDVGALAAAQSSSRLPNSRSSPLLPQTDVFALAAIDGVLVLTSPYRRPLATEDGVETLVAVDQVTVLVTVDEVVD